MDLAFQTDGTCLRVALPEELDHPVSDKIRKDTDKIINETYIRTLIFDFQNTNFMDSSGIGLLMGRYRALGMRNGCIRAENVNPHIEKLLHLSGVYKYIQIIRQN